MFCPRCGEERISEATSFCSRCGFLLTAASELILTGGAPIARPARDDDPPSPRTRGIRMGIFMILLMLVIAPILGIISTFVFRFVPWPMGIVIFLLGGGGLLRIAYAMMFESKYPMRLPAAQGVEQPALDGAAATHALPHSTFAPPISTPTSGRWLDTNDLEPHSVTDHTTKLLEKDDQDI